MLGCLPQQFAWRLLAKPGDSEFNRLAVNAKFFLCKKGIFFLLPKVDSSVVIIWPKDHIRGANPL